jgi:hypothetical protein
MTKFRYSGENVNGFDVTAPGPQRSRFLHVLCSVLNFCATEIYPYASKNEVAPVTLARLQRLILIPYCNPIPS